jgi:hypothetical protein
MRCPGLGAGASFLTLLVKGLPRDREKPGVDGYNSAATAHDAIKPVLDLIADENRFSDKIMRK